jgi:hypothetical protein
MLATPKDIQASVVVIALYAFTAIVGIPRVVLDVFVAQAMFGRIVWLSAIVYLLYHKLYLTAVFLVVLGIRTTFDADMSYAFSHDGILAKYAALQKTHGLVPTLRTSAFSDPARLAGLVKRSFTYPVAAAGAAERNQAHMTSAVVLAGDGAVVG